MEHAVYTDGSCKGNPGPGGIGAVVYRDGAIVDTFSQGYYKTTNNRMELLAVITALEKYGKADTITVWTDSEYVQKGMTQWKENWKRNGWMRTEKGKKKEVKNKDLWQKLDTLADDHVVFQWVKGHAADEGNEMADRLAVMASSRGPFVHDGGFSQ